MELEDRFEIIDKNTQYIEENGSEKGSPFPQNCIDISRWLESILYSIEGYNALFSTKFQVSVSTQRMTRASLTSYTVTSSIEALYSEDYYRENEYPGSWDYTTLFDKGHIDEIYHPSINLVKPYDSKIVTINNREYRHVYCIFQSVYKNLEGEVKNTVSCNDHTDLLPMFFKKCIINKFGTL